MIDKVLHKDVVDAIEIHWRLQMDTYFHSVHDLEGAIYNLGRRVKDYYWNYAGLIRTKNGQEAALIDKIVKFAKQHAVVPAVYIDPTVNPPSFIEFLKKKRFQPEDEEIWMFFDPLAKVNYKKAKDLKITKVKNAKEMEIFVSIFNDSFELLDKDQENSVYGLSLLDAYSNRNMKVQITHFIGWVGETPVSVASTYLHDDVAGIYNVGTPEQFRRQGFGAALSIAAIEESKKNNCRRILLQTELGSGPERLYSNLGFVQAFSAAIWALPS
jgi:GNAT superfamily N-acetyltransferase